jgi:predicted O-methyltransferase YrrM
MTIEKIRTLGWFLKRPNHWVYAMELGLRKMRADHDSAKWAERAGEWAAQRAVSVEEALVKVGLLQAGMPIPIMADSLLDEGRERAGRSRVRMGGAGDLDLLHAAVRLSGARSVVETGVAYGWSSLAILAGFEPIESSRLVSVDMPYPKLNNESFVGIAVPGRFRASWQIIREPDRRGLEKAIRLIGGGIDLCHYDSDKSYWGRRYAFPLLWRALGKGGVFISDDIQDNFGFKEFVEDGGLQFAVTEYEGKFIGIARKP